SSAGIKSMAETPDRLRQILERIRNHTEQALSLLTNPGEQRALAWKCAGFGHVKHFTKPVLLEVVARCPRCKSDQFQLQRPRPRKGKQGRRISEHDKRLRRNLRQDFVKEKFQNHPLDCRCPANCKLPTQRLLKWHSGKCGSALTLATQPVNLAAMNVKLI